MFLYLKQTILFVGGKPFPTGLMFASKAGVHSKWSTFLVLPSKVGSCPYPQTETQFARDKHSNLFGQFVSYQRKLLIILAPGARIKRNGSILYQKLDRFSSNLVSFTLSITNALDWTSMKYIHYKFTMFFCNTGPWTKFSTLELGVPCCCFIVDRQTLGNSTKPGPSFQLCMLAYVCMKQKTLMTTKTA